jgi:LPS sulfotransferase NodH
MTERFDYFVVFAEMRTGSNFLESNLNALDGVTCHGEAFNPHFIGYPKTHDILGVTQKQRDRKPGQLLDAVRDDPKGMAGFRYFHDHDPRVLDQMLDDPRCAKIILTRNPAESYISWKIAKATGQWKLTDVKRRKDGAAVFDADEFSAHVEALQGFQLQLMNRLQSSGQTAFYVAYEDLQSVDVMNGIAAFLGVPARLDKLDKTLKVQNPAPLSQKVANFAEMEAALAGVDRYNLTRTPNFEPRRSAVVPTYVAGAEVPLIFLPIQGGPVNEVEAWLAGLDGVDKSDLRRRMNQKELRQWKRQHPRHRSFTVLRHPIARAHHVFCQKILGTSDDAYPQIRHTLAKQYQVDVPEDGAGETWSKSQHREAFGAFLVFLKANLSGQTAIRVDATWCSQTHVLQGFANFVLPDQIIREDDMMRDLTGLATSCGINAEIADITTSSDNPYTLADIYDEEIEALGKAAYQRDYMMFGFGPWGEG